MDKNHGGDPKFALIGSRKVFAPISEVDGIQELCNQGIEIEVGIKRPHKKSYTFLPKRLVNNQFYFIKLFISVINYFLGKLILNVKAQKNASKLKWWTMYQRRGSFIPMIFCISFSKKRRIEEIL